MYLRGRQNASHFLTTYGAEGPLSNTEMTHLDAFSRLREVVQGVCFAGRIATNDLTGAIQHAENDKGLRDARRRLDALGSPTG